MVLFAVAGMALLGLSGMVAQEAKPAAPSPTTAQSNQEKARAVLQQTIQALGGDKYLNLHDSYIEGRLGGYYHGESEGEVLFFRYWEWPDKERVELTKDRDVVELYNGDRAYELTYRGARNLDPEKEKGPKLHLVRSQHSLETVLRSWISAPGTALFYEGTRLAENKMTDQVTVLNSQNDAVTLLIDTDTHLPVRKMFTIREPQTGYRDEEVEIYDNWRMVQGINTPYTVQVTHNGEIARQQAIQKVTYNMYPPESWFEPNSGLVNRKK